MPKDWPGNHRYGSQRLALAFAFGYGRRAFVVHATPARITQPSDASHSSSEPSLTPSNSGVEK